MNSGEAHIFNVGPFHIYAEPSTCEPPSDHINMIIDYGFAADGQVPDISNDPFIFEADR